MERTYLIGKHPSTSELFKHDGIIILKVWHTQKISLLHGNPSTEVILNLMKFVNSNTTQFRRNWTTVISVKTLFSYFLSHQIIISYKTSNHVKIKHLFPSISGKSKTPQPLKICRRFPHLSNLLASFLLLSVLDIC